MSNEYRHVELLTGGVRRRRWTTEQKLTIIEQSVEPGETVSSTARRHGVAPSLLYRWRRLLSEEGDAVARGPQESLHASNDHGVPDCHEGMLKKFEQDASVEFVVERVNGKQTVTMVK